MKNTCAAIRLTSLAVALLVSILAVPLRADVAHKRGDFQPDIIRIQQKKAISREEAAAIVKRRYGGKILAISEVQRNGRSLYRVKGLSKQSQVYVVYVDKHSGRISRS